MTSIVPGITAAGPGPRWAASTSAELQDLLDVTVDLPRDPARPGEAQCGPATGPGAGRSAVVRAHRRPVRSWPLLVLAAPAAVAVWSGWVGIGQMTGFGQIHPLPGIWASLHLDTAVTLPIGVEAYAAFALRVWLTSSPAVSDRTRGFARRSAIAALILGMAGQVAYHLLAQAGITRAPWEVTTVVACLPVLVLGMGSALAHLLRSDAVAAPGLDRSDRRDPGANPGIRDHGVRHLPTRERLQDAYAAAARIMASGQHVSRRTLRSAGLHGSNTELSAIAQLIKSKPPTDQGPPAVRTG